MSYTIANKYLFFGSLIIILALFFGGWYIGSSRDKKALNTTIEAQKQEIQKLTVQISDTEYQVTKVEQELATEKELRKKDIFEKKELTALNLKQANEITEMKLRIDTLLEDVEHNGQIITILDSQIKNIDKNMDTVSKYKAIRLPFEFQKKDQWLDLKGRFDDNGKLGIDLSMSLDVNAVSGTDKDTKKPTIALYTDNKYIKTIGIASYKTDTPRTKRYGIGIQAGYGITKSGVSPVISTGISYNFVTF